MSRFLVSCLLASLAVGCSSSSLPVPDALSAIEGDAEHAYDVALVEDYATLSETATSIDTQWGDFRPTAEADGASADVLGAVDGAVAGLLDAADAQGGAAATGRAANAVSEHMSDLYDLYGPKVPVQILALDYQGREVVLDGMDSDFTAAISDVDAITTTWGGVRQQVVDAGGDQEAADFDASVDALKGLAAGTDGQALIDEANNSLELVDVLEGVF